MTKSNLAEILDRLEGAFSRCLESPSNGPHEGLALLQKIRQEECGADALPLDIRQRDELHARGEREIRDAIESRIKAQQAEDDAFNRDHPQQHPAEEKAPRKKRWGFGRGEPEGEGEPNAALEGDQVV